MGGSPALGRGIVGFPRVVLVVNEHDLHSVLSSCSVMALTPARQSTQLRTERGVVALAYPAARMSLISGVTSSTTMLCANATHGD